MTLQPSVLVVPGPSKSDTSNGTGVFVAVGAGIDVAVAPVGDTVVFLVQDTNDNKVKAVITQIAVKINLFIFSPPFLMFFEFFTA